MNTNVTIHFTLDHGIDNGGTDPFNTKLSTVCLAKVPYMYNGHINFDQTTITPASVKVVI